MLPGGSAAYRRGCMWGWCHLNLSNSERHPTSLTAEMLQSGKVICVFYQWSYLLCKGHWLFFFLSLSLICCVDNVGLLSEIDWRMIRKREKLEGFNGNKKRKKKGGRPVWETEWEEWEGGFGSWTLFILNEVKTLRFTLNPKCCFPTIAVFAECLCAPVRMCWH